MNKSKLRIRQLADEINLTLLAGEKGLDRVVEVEMISRPGLELGGEFEFIDKDRIILIGVKESKYLDSLPKKTAKSRVNKLMSYNPPAVIFSNNPEVELVLKYFVDAGNKYNIPIFRSNLNTTPLNAQLYYILHDHLAPRIGVHGVLLDIHGMGILITGKSGIGKSETALELIKRGHLLVSDDVVDIYERNVNDLVGTAPKILRRYLEIRGIGIVDVLAMFGTGAFRTRKRIDLVVELERWQNDKIYDRIGITNETVKYFHSEVPKIIIPILPGRNVATLVESAAMNQKLKNLGMNAAVNFLQAVDRKNQGGRKK